VQAPISFELEVRKFNEDVVGGCGAQTESDKKGVIDGARWRVNSYELGLAAEPHGDSFEER